MKPHTSRYKDYYNEKYPITSNITGNTYLIRIRPRDYNDERYSEGCIVTLYRHGKFLNKQLEEFYMDNRRNEKITVSYVRNRKDTDFDYNLINMAKLAVSIYETEKNLNNESILTLEKDFKEFEKWDGNIDYGFKD